MDHKANIGFIGAGNMSNGMVSGLVGAAYPSEAIFVYDVHPEKAQGLAARQGIQALNSLVELLSRSEVIVLAVKPQNMKSLLVEIRPHILPDSNPLFVSVAAGIELASLAAGLGPDVAIVRAMPNTPAILQSGMTGLYAKPNLSETQRNLAESLMRSVGLTIWVESEYLLNPLTALSGSGPAYFFYLMEAMIKAGQAWGFSEKDANILVLQTALGAAKMALESQHSPNDLRAQVTSKGGTTEAAIRVLEEKQFESMIQSALEAAHDRSLALSGLLK